MADLSKRVNSIQANPDVFRYPTTSDIEITNVGTSVYWAITAVMGLSTIGFVFWASRLPRDRRIFHYITASITLVACIAYYTMAANLGYAAIPVEFSHQGMNGYREIFYVRYIDWVITTPLLLLDLLLTSGMPWPTIIYTLLIDEVMIVTGLVGALTASSYKWGYFVFAMLALFFIAYNVCIVGRAYSRSLGSRVFTTYQTGGVWTIALWFLYPIAWGLSEGGNYLTPNHEAIFYSVLDVLAKPVFGLILLAGHRSINPALLGIGIQRANHVNDIGSTRADYKTTFGRGGGGSGEKTSRNTSVGPDIHHNGTHNNGTSNTATFATNGTHNGTGVPNTVANETV